MMSNSTHQILCYESVSDIESSLKCRFFDYLSEQFGSDYSENGIIDEFILSGWGTLRIFLAKMEDGSVGGCGFIMPSDIEPNSLELSAMCYLLDFPVIGRDILTTASLARNEHFASSALFVDLGARNSAMRAVVRALGFVRVAECPGGAKWERFVLKLDVKEEVVVIKEEEVDDLFEEYSRREDNTSPTFDLVALTSLPLSGSEYEPAAQYTPEISPNCSPESEPVIEPAAQYTPEISPNCSPESEPVIEPAAQYT
eukprot:755000_1